ncbi:MAG: ferrous iron transport protein A [Atopobiaceae bacterium]|nr:ferrous iron transport protein A [Atopobiaceae bacterium]MCI2172981.1 ferrous iron transport protein A [Atopobiaceae bacterium]MCI2208386.1 ferrous iron transport protein A [Atopobiaceae bacterium]
MDEGRIGSTYEVSYLDLPDATKHRLESLGMTPSITVEVLNNKSHGTVIIRLRETRFALGRGISRGIHVTPVGEGTTSGEVA